MNNVFVLNASLYSHTGAATVDTLATINTLADGSPAFFYENGVKVLDTGTFVKTNEEIVNLFMGRGATTGLLKARINVPTLKYTKQAYVAPVASVQHLGWNGAAGSINLNSVSKQGSYYGITFTDLTKEVYERRNFNVELTTPVDNVTEATVIATLVAAINADPNIMACVATVVAVSTKGIAFTGKAGKNFSFKGNGLIEGSTYADTDALVIGANSTDWALRTENSGATVDGKSSGLPPTNEAELLYTVPSRVVAGANYTVYTLCSSWLRAGYPSANANAQESYVTILVPAANATMIASLDAILLNLTVPYVAPAA